MTNRWRNRIGMLLVSTPFLMLSATGCLAAKPTAAEPGDEIQIEPEAMTALNEMGNYLRTLKSFTVSSEMSMDEVLLSGQKILLTGTTEYSTRLPDRLRVSSKVEGLDRDNEYYYDGKSFTIYSNLDKYYATFEAPDTIGKLLDIAEDRYDVEIPLRDLFYWGTEKDRGEDVQAAYFIDTSRINGTPCKHYAFRQEDVDWQIWIEDDDTPLPLRLVITSKLEIGAPQYISTMTWNVAPQLTDSTFVFTPPEGAHKIEFAVIDDPEEESTQQ
ncbi:DUF2092 domain-containing protein [Desulfopila aestuarii]|uniref:Outer membrane lipoprotein-sorting protein n=1 Tax=Desulfopila aestuarii DSM 18488 TaxID=1121416 RepID=A0A1M7XWR3_9BACT|nr:DUF2092 domain-containing protein [Desulfopila aestuarii]SHO43221.1 hypothetical protein SAMN02745220_00341 [Desulfopila aestuarii DSM 18488]